MVLIKIHSKLRMIKVICENCTTNIILIGERERFFPPKIRNKIRIPTLVIYIQQCTGSYSQGNQGNVLNEIKGTDWKERSKTISIHR